MLTMWRCIPKWVRNVVVLVVTGVLWVLGSVYFQDMSWKDAIVEYIEFTAVLYVLFNLIPWIIFSLWRKRS